MKKYFLNGQTNENAALSFEELKSKGLQSTDFVWFEGLDTWKPIENINELKKFVNTSTPKLKESNEQKTYLSPQIGLWALGFFCVLYFKEQLSNYWLYLFMTTLGLIKSIIDQINKK